MTASKQLNAGDRRLTHAGELDRFDRRIIGAQTLYALGAALCVVNTYVSISFILLVRLNFAVGPRRGWLSRI